MPDGSDGRWVNESVTEPTEWTPDTTGPARPRHIRDAEAAQPEQEQRWKRTRAVAEGVGRAAPYVGGASWVVAAAATDWDDDGHGDVIDLGPFTSDG